MGKFVYFESTGDIDHDFKQMEEMTSAEATAISLLNLNLNIEKIAVHLEEIARALNEKK